MAGMTGSVIPQVKIEQAPDVDIKAESVDVDMPSPAYADDYEDALEEAGDLEYSGANQPMWLSHIPKSLWDALDKLDADDEIDLGTISIEGPEDDPTRVSKPSQSVLATPTNLTQITLKLNRLHQLEDQHKEFDLRRPPPEKIRSKRPGQALIFSEKDLPGYKSKSFVYDMDDEENAGQGRSKLYDDAKRKAKRKEKKESNEGFQPYRRKAIPKKTALAGVVTKEFDAVPVRNAEYNVVEQRKLAKLLATQRPKLDTQILSPDMDPTRRQNLTSIVQRQRENKAAAAKRQAIKDNRTARIEKPELISMLLEHFKRHRIWGLRDLKAVVRQPEQYLRETLAEIAFMHKHGDFNGKWELQDNYKANDHALLYPEGLEAPKMEDSEMEASGVDDDEDEDEKFEDV
jgi:transcription initiation factor TFIIF subunit beta